MRTPLRVQVGLLLLCGAAAPGLAATRSIESFQKLESEWPTFALTGTVFTLEGRYSSMSKTALRFEKCNLSFQAREGYQFPRLLTRSRTVEVVGSLQKRRGRLEFVVDRLKQMPSDLDRLHSELAGLRERTAEAYYELGRWVQARASFYEDEEFAQEAADIFWRGIQQERRQLEDGDAEGLLALAARLPDYNQPASLQQEYVHEAFHMLWSASQKEGEPPAENLAVRLKETLDGADTPLTDPASELRREYLADPLTTYRDTTDEETRLKLHRIFYGEVRLATIEGVADPDGRDGYMTAAKIGQWLPERSDLVESWRQKELMYRLANVTEADRRDVVELAELFNARGQPAHARQAITAWLDAREARLRERGPGGLMQLADEHLSLLEDRSKASELLIEAYELSPVKDEIAERLEKLDFVREEGRWLTKEELRARPPDELEAAVSEGRIELGMTGRQVRQAIGVPTAVTRIASRKQIYEIWIYGERDSSRLAVHFLKRDHQPQAKMVAISQER